MLLYCKYKNIFFVLTELLLRNSLEKRLNEKSNKTFLIIIFTLSVDLL